MKPSLFNHRASRCAAGLIAVAWWSSAFAADPVSPEFQAGLATVRAHLDAGEAGDVLPVGRRLLRSLADDATVAAADRAQVYALMFEGARRNRNLNGGNVFASDLQKDDRRRYGPASVERVPGLYEAARWFDWADLADRERKALNTAVSLLEQNYGPRDARLAYPLRQLASSCVRSRSDADVARSALDRALKLEYADTQADVLSRAEVFATRGDVEALFAEPAAGTSWYRAAWQRLADSKLAGPELARKMFAEPVPIYVNVPDAPFTSRRGNVDHFASGTVSFAFSVSPVGTVEQLRLRQSLVPMDSVPEPVTHAFRDARYRPRMVAGEPVATADHGFELRFTRQESAAKRRIIVGTMEEQR
ncbi:MAG: hypothetical protein ABIX37_07835 [Gammaproteobacteria bacterium]